MSLREDICPGEDDAALEGQVEMSGGWSYRVADPFDPRLAGQIERPALPSAEAGADRT